jgi:hypothetical protein
MNDIHTRPISSAGSGSASRAAGAEQQPGRNSSSSSGRGSGDGVITQRRSSELERLPRATPPPLPPPPAQVPAPPPTPVLRSNPIPPPPRVVAPREGPAHTVAALDPDRPETLCLIPIVPTSLTPPPPTAAESRDHITNHLARVSQTLQQEAGDDPPRRRRLRLRNLFRNG